MANSLAVVVPPPLNPNGGRARTEVPERPSPYADLGQEQAEIGSLSAIKK